MLESQKIDRRQSVIRQSLAELVGIESPSEDEVRSMSDMDKEYQTNEVRRRATYAVEDTERKEAGAELETRSESEWSDMLGNFSMHQVALALDEGAALSGQTQEIVSELRSQNGGGFQGLPVPWQVLEVRTGETIASGTPDPIRTAPILDRIFSQTAAARMGARMINIGSGQMEYPITSSNVSAGWQATELGDVSGPSVYTTVDRPLKPDHTLGITMTLSRKSLKQSGPAIESAVRRDMAGCIGEALDAAVFQGSGTSGEPTGIFAGAAAWGITETALSGAPTWAAMRSAVVRFMIASAAGSPSAVKLLIRPEVYDDLDGTIFDAGSGLTQWDRLLKNIPAANIVMSPNALAASAGSPLSTMALLTTSTGSNPAITVGAYGAIDLIRDPYSSAASGALKLTALATMDVTISRAEQLEVITGIE